MGLANNVGTARPTVKARPVVSMSKDSFLNSEDILAFLFIQLSSVIDDRWWL